MEELKSGKSDNDWKKDLRSKLITAIVGTEQEKLHLYSEIGYFYECYAPATIFKYYPDKLERLADIKAKKMWYSAPSAFNDVFDCDIAIDEKGIFDSALLMCPDKRGIRAGSPKWKELKNVIHQEIRSFRSTWDTLRVQTGISCLSESEQSLLMWAHYANNHRGMCVEYDLLEINKQLRFSAVPVIYSADRVCFRSINMDSIHKDSLCAFVESVSSKSPEWSYEKEWRIIRDHAACGDKWDDVKKGALLDMISPTSITLGCQAEDLFERAVSAYCKENEISLYKMERDESLYQLNRNPIMLFDD